MAIEFDPAKDATNVEKHGVSLAVASEMDMTLAEIVEDTRPGYGEQRFVAVGPIYDRLHVMVFTTRGEDIRVISLRKANTRERKRFTA